MIIIPFTIDSDTSSYIAPYLIYSLFLTSIGIIIGVSLTWLNYPNKSETEENNTKPELEKRPLSADEKVVSDLLILNSGEMWVNKSLSKKNGDIKIRFFPVIKNKIKDFGAPFLKALPS